MSRPLSELQRLFHGHVRSGGAEAAVTMRQAVIGDARGSAGVRLGVYVDAYRLRLTEALAADYPALRAVLGTPAFERLSAAYIAAHPSTTPSIRWFGRHLPGYLRTEDRYAERPALADLALFEWQQGETFDAPDARSLSIADVAAIAPLSWPAMRLIFQPSVRRLDLHSNAPALVAARAEPGATRPALRHSGRRTPWLMWRDAALDIRWRSIGAEEAAAFDAASEHRSFAELCELLCQFITDEQAPMHAASLLKRWVGDGLVTAIDSSG